MPDFDNVATCVEVGENYVNEVQDLLALMIGDYEINKKELPIPSDNIEVANGQKLVYINVWMPYHRAKTKEIFVKKTLTIPSWLDILAKKQNVNFSSILRLK